MRYSRNCGVARILPTVLALAMYAKDPEKRERRASVQRSQRSQHKRRCRGLVRRDDCDSGKADTRMDSFTSYPISLPHLPMPRAYHAAEGVHDFSW
jgi:hypothetical protein